MRVKKLKRMLLRKRNAVVLAVAALTVCIVKNFGLGYSISLDSDGFPNASFTTNVTNQNPTTMNLFNNGLNTSLYSDSFKSNFTVIKNFGVSDGTYPLYTVTRSDVYKDNTISKYGFFPTNKETIEISNELQNPTNVSDAGLKYILRYGYNKTNVGHTIFDRQDLINQYAAVTDNSERQYITQIAIWVYMHKNANNFANSYCKNGRCTFTDGNAAISNNDLTQALIFAATRDKKLGFVKELLDGAASASNTSNAAAYEIAASKFNEYTFKNNREYILTGSISLSNVDSTKFISWSATVVDPNHYGIYITDVNNNKLSNASGVADNLASNAVIRLHIPLKADLTQMNLSTSGVSLTFNLVGDSDSVIAKSYRVTSTSNGEVLLEDNENQGNKKDKFAEVLVGVVKQTTATKRYTLSNFTDIRKTDLDSGEEIGGAHLALYNASDIGEDFKPKANAVILKDESNNNIEWISVEGESHKLYLQDGSYGLCETMAPDGYELKTTCEIFEVNNGSAITVHAMTNKLIPIPNTGSFRSYIPYLIGGISLIGGAGTIIILTKRKKKESC